MQRPYLGMPHRILALAAEECTFDFGTLIAHLAKTRRIGAGSIIGSGTVSNRDSDGSPGRPCSEGGRGYSCIAEQRMVETIATGAATTPFLRYGDVVRIEMRDDHGHTIFGAIEQRIAGLPAGRRPKLYLAGESLGAFGSNGIFDSPDDLLTRAAGGRLLGVGDQAQVERPQMGDALGQEGVLLADDFGCHLEDGLGPLVEALG